MNTPHARDLTPVLPRRARSLIFLMSALTGLVIAALFGIDPAQNGLLLICRTPESLCIGFIGCVLTYLCPWRGLALIGSVALIALQGLALLPEPTETLLTASACLAALAAFSLAPIALAIVAKGGPRRTALRRFGLGLSLALLTALVVSLPLRYTPPEVQHGVLAALALLGGVGLLRIRMSESELGALAEDSDLPQGGFYALRTGRRLLGLLIAIGSGFICGCLYLISMACAADSLNTYFISAELLIGLGMVLCTIGCTSQLRRRSAFFTAMRLAVALLAIALILLTAPELLSGDLAVACSACLLLGGIVGGLVLFVFGTALSVERGAHARDCAVLLLMAFIGGACGACTLACGITAMLITWAVVGALAVAYAFLCLRGEAER